MKRFISSLLFLSLLFIAPLASADKAKKVQLLFVMRASTATITKTDKGLELTLKNTEPKTLYFSDRPNRIAGLMMTDKFMASWLKSGSSFSVNPPNASIIFEEMPADKHGVAKAVAVEMKNPVAMSDGSWKYSLTDLEGKMNIGSYTGVIVFIDTRESTYSTGNGQPNAQPDDFVDDFGMK